MKEKLTQWFGADWTPARRGWYDTALRNEELDLVERRYWNGKWWSFARDKSSKSATQDWSWRGLAQDPSQ